MVRAQRFLASTIGKKVVMAVTGLLLLGFLVGHLSGNLMLYKGDGGRSFNDYGHMLTSTPLIYVAEAGLLGLLVAHVWAAVSLSRLNREARPVAYAVDAKKGHTSRKSVASSTMLISGSIILFFLVIHIATFKFGAHYAAPHDDQVRDLNRLVLESFGKWWYAGAYVLFMIVLGFHLWHAFSSATQTLGVRYDPLVGKIGKAVGVILALGFLSFPILLFFREAQS